MNINPQAIEAAVKATGEVFTGMGETLRADFARITLKAALPHIEADIRAQIADDIKTANFRDWKSGSRPATERNGYDAGMVDAARIAEGTNQ